MPLSCTRAPQVRTGHRTERVSAGQAASETASPRRSGRAGRRPAPTRARAGSATGSAAAGCSAAGWASAAGGVGGGGQRADRAAAGDPQLEADLGEQVGELDVEGVADRGEELRGGFLLPALDLRQVAEADPGGAGDVAQRAALTQPVATQGVPELGAQQRHGRLLSCERGSGGALAGAVRSRYAAPAPGPDRPARVR